MSFGVLNPAGALAFAAVAVLLALYLRGRRRRVVPVATLFLWQRVPAQALDPRRFRPDLLFLAQLALLLALIGGYLRPYVEDLLPASEGVRLLIVLDASASMQAREEGGTRFDLARGRARALVAQLLTGDEVMLVAAADRTHVVLRWTGDHARALDRLEALEALDTPTDLAPALELALGEVRARPETRAVVFTDLPREASGVALERLAAVDYVEIGRTDDNLAIAGLHVEQPPFRPASEASVTVLVRSYAHAPHHVVLEARVGDEPWTRQELTVPARGTEHVLLTRPPAAGELTVTLEANDALAVDDRAVAWLAAGEPFDVLVVTASSALAAIFRDLGTTIAGSHVRTVEPAVWEAERETAARVLVLDGVAPDALPVPALYVAPPAGNQICPTARTAEGAAVVDWETEHPALRGLAALEALSLAGTAELLTPAWGTAVVLAATERGAFPFLIAGERDGQRIACLGAAPLASSDDLPLLLLTLGTLAWLEERPGAAPLTVQTGVPVPIAGDPPVLVAERTGVQRVGERVVLANLFDDRESDIGRTGDREWPARAGPAVATTVPGARREVGWWLYVAAAALLVLEWAVWVHRARSEA